MTEEKTDRKLPACATEGHKVKGFNCVVCGWTMKLLNLYVPPGKVPSRAFVEELSGFLEVGTKIVLVRDAEVPTINEVGFELDMHDKLYLTTQMLASLEDQKEA